MLLKLRQGRVALLETKHLNMKLICAFFFVFLLSPTILCLAARPEPDGNNGGGYGGYFGPGSGFSVPGFGNGIVGGGYGAGFGGPNGGYGKGGIVRPTVVCDVKGPCYKKKLTCPAKCFHSYSRAGKGYGGGGGGGGCTMDCKKKCIAYC